MSKVLIFSPHPDDFSFFMGGTLLKHCAEGDEVKIILMSRGEKGTWLSSQSHQARLAKLRVEEANASLPSGVMLLVWDGEDLKLNQQKLNEVRLEADLGSWKPDLVYLPEFHSADSLFQHPDHLATGLQVTEYYSKKEIQPKFRYYHSRAISRRVKVDPYLHDSNILLRQHQSQYSFFCKPPFLLYFAEKIRVFFLKKNGKQLGCEYAEGFRET